MLPARPGKDLAWVTPATPGMLQQGFFPGLKFIHNHVQRGYYNHPVFIEAQVSCSECNSAWLNRMPVLMISAVEIAN